MHPKEAECSAPEPTPSANFEDGSSHSYQPAGFGSLPLTSAPPSPVTSAQVVVVKEEVYDQDTDEDDQSIARSSGAGLYTTEGQAHIKEDHDQDTDEDEEAVARSSGAGLFTTEGQADIKDEIHGSEFDYSLSPARCERALRQHKRKWKRSEAKTNELQCFNCSTFKRREKFSSKQWERGSAHQGKKVYCRRCEEKILVRKEVGPKLEKLCVRIHTKESRRGKSKYLSTLIPLNTKLAFLPSELTLDGYTREHWSLEGNAFESAWQTATLRCLVGEEKMKDFVKFLVERKKSAYGTFMLKDGTDGFFFVPFYQSVQDDNMSSTHKKVTSSTITCKYILGLGLGLIKDKTKTPIEECLSSTDTKDTTEDYISSSALGSLLFAQSRTDDSLAVVPKGSVKSAPKLKPSPNRKKNLGYSRDWHGPKTFVGEEK